MEKYNIIKKISEGSLGVAYLAETKSTKTRFLMKISDIRQLSKEKRIQLVNEVNLLKALSHNNIPRYRESFIHEK